MSVKRFRPAARTGRTVLFMALMAALVLATGVPIASGTWVSGFETMLVSQHTDGTAGDEDSWEGRCSDDGNLVVFTSEAGTLADNDDTPADVDGERDVFLRDVAAGTTTLISAPRAGAAENDRGSRDPDISDDGRYIVLFSGQDFVASDTNGGQDVYVYDTETDAWERLDITGDGTTSPGDDIWDTRISGDGSAVVFEAREDLLPEDNANRDVYYYDIAGEELKLISEPRAGGTQTTRGSRDVTVSDDGRYVAFLSGQDFLASDTNGDQDIYIRDMETGDFEIAMTPVPVEDDTWDIQISGNGRYVVFTSENGDLSDDDENGWDRRDVFVYDRETEETMLVSSPREDATQWDRGSRDPVISDDGRYILFLSGQDLVAGDTNGLQDVYLKDMVSDIVMRIPVTIEGTAAGDDVWDFFMSGDGAWFGFTGWGAYFAPGDTNRDDDVFIRQIARPVADGAARLAGENRYATAIDVSEKTFPMGADTVVVATGANWPDALGGSALAGAVGGPILLTTPDALPASVKAEIVRLGARDAYILGGTGAVSAAVENELNAILPGYVTRLGGLDRYGTSRAVANRAIELLGPDFDGTCFVATGKNFPDAIGAAPLASGLGWPILLTPDGTVYTPADMEKAVILGGVGAVPAALETSLKTEFGNDMVVRLGGATRYETAAMVADYGTDNGMLWNGVGISTGQLFPDALAGGAALGLERSVVLLTPPTSLHAAAQAKLTENKDDIDAVRFLGGTGAVSAAVEAQVKTLLGL